MLKKITVIGGGAWGTALACLIARAVGVVNLYVIEDSVVDEVNNKRPNSKYLGNVKLAEGIHATSNIKDVIDSDVIILATQSYVFEEILQQLKQEGIAKSIILLIATKGLCENPMQLFSDKVEGDLDNLYALIWA